MSIKFPPASLGPEMAAPIYGRLAFFCSFCWKTPMPIKFLLLGGGGGCWDFLRRGGVEVPILLSSCFEGESPGGTILRKCEKSAKKCENF